MNNSRNILNSAKAVAILRVQVNHAVPGFGSVELFGFEDMV